MYTYIRTAAILIELKTQDLVFMWISFTVIQSSISIDITNLHAILELGTTNMYT